MKSKQTKKMLCECGAVFRYSKKDLQFIEEIVDDKHRISPQFQVICPKCGREYKIWDYDLEK